MEKYIYDSSNGLWYELQGGDYIPCLTLPEEEHQPVGIWGQRHKAFLKGHRKAAYTTMRMEGKLNSCLAGIDHQVQEMYLRLISEMADRQGATEQLKALQTSKPIESTYGNKGWQFQYKTILLMVWTCTIENAIENAIEKCSHLPA